MTPFALQPDAVLPTTPAAAQDPAGEAGFSPPPEEVVQLPTPRPARIGWALPFALSLAFVIAFAAWLQWSDQIEVDDRQRTLISDALSLEGRLGSRIGEEQLRLDALAGRLDRRLDTEALARLPEVADGLRRAWLSLTWLDAGNRILAHLPEDAPRPAGAVPRSRLGETADDAAQSAHLSAALPYAAGGGRLVVRYSPAALLRQSLPWWLARAYDVRLVDSFGQVLGSSSAAPIDASAPSHRVSLEPALSDAFLELIARDRFRPWWATPMPALMAVFLLLIAGASALLRSRVLALAHAEAAWRTEAAWRRAMEDSLTVGLRARDHAGRLVYVNRAFCELTGYTADELIGSGPPMPYWPPGTIDDGWTRHRRNMAGGAPREGYETRWVRSDGRSIDVMIFEAPLVDAEGRTSGWMGSIVDVTLRRRMQERERLQGESLAHQARLTMLGEVASALAHELNQPLTAITSYNAGVRRSLARDGIDRAALLAALDRQAEQADRAGRIVKRIREFLTRRAPQRERCDLVEIAGHAASLMRRDLQRIGAKLDWAPPAGLPPVFADPVLIEQVVINLVRNAVDELAPAAHPVAVADAVPAPASAPRLRLIVARAGERFLRLGVDDNGPGLAGRTVEQLCSPFYSTKPDGMGMGLAICRSVIESHHGALDAGTSPLGGASFSFTLPLYRSEVAVDAPVTPPEASADHPKDPPPVIPSPMPAEFPP